MDESYKSKLCDKTVENINDALICESFLNMKWGYVKAFVP